MLALKSQIAADDAEVLLEEDAPPSDDRYPPPHTTAKVGLFPTSDGDVGSGGFGDFQRRLEATSSGSGGAGNEEEEGVMLDGVETLLRGGNREQGLSSPPEYDPEVRLSN